MTVRAWFTISAVVVAGLVAAVAFQLFRPVPTPAIIVRVGDIRLEGWHVISCWPQHSGKRCSPDDEPRELIPRSIPGTGSMRVVVAYPVQPKEGAIRILAPGKGTVLRKKWTNTVHYHLAPGDYVLVAEAVYAPDAFVTYNFAFKITRSGS